MSANGCFCGMCVEVATCGNDPSKAQTQRFKAEENWSRFIAAGQWTKRRPTNPGLYRVADFEGNQCRNPRVLVQVPGVPVLVDPDGAWGGFWWSKAMPELPPCVPSDVDAPFIGSVSC